MSNNIKFLGCLKYLKKPININNINNINNVINKTDKINNIYKINFLKSKNDLSLSSIKNFNDNIINNNKRFYSVGNNSRFLKNKQILNNLKKGKHATSTSTITTTTDTENNKNILKNENEGFNFNYVNPDQIKPFRPRHLPFETTTRLDFLVTPGQPIIESKETLDKYLKLAKALSAVGFEHQESQRWEQALESFNKALFYIRNIFGSPNYRSKIDLRDFAILLGNSAESLGRIDKMNEALVKSQQSIDVLEVYWREHAEKYGLANAKRGWQKDETLGIFYSNYSEYLLDGDRYDEAEPFLMRAHEILSKVYPLDHPVNVELGISLVKVLNEMGRSLEVEKIFKKYGDIITNAMGKTEEFKHIAEKVETEIKYQMVEQIKNQYPELELDHKDFDENNKDDDDDGDIIEYDEDGNFVVKKKNEFNQINKEQDIDEEDEDNEEDIDIEGGDDGIYKYKYKEREFDIQDLMLIEGSKHMEENEDEFEDNQIYNGKGSDIIKQNDLNEEVFKERDFDELEEEEDENEFFEYDKGDEDEGDREDLVNSISPKEEYLNLKLEEELDQLKEKGEKIYSPKHPLGNLLNSFDDIFHDATKKLSEMEAEKIVDREQRLLNKHSGIPERVIWENGKILTPTDEKGEPVSQGAIDKWGKYYAEDLIDDKQDEDEMIDQYIEKMSSLLDNMSKEESELIDMKFKRLVPTLKTILKQDNPEDYFNTTLEDAEEDDNEQIKEVEEKIKKLNRGLKEIKERKEILPKDNDGYLLSDKINEEDLLKEYDVSEDFSIFDDEDEELELNQNDSEDINSEELDEEDEDSEEEEEEDDDEEDSEENEDSEEEEDEDSEEFTDENYAYEEEDYEITEDTSNLTTNYSNNTNSGTSSISQESLVKFMDIANKCNFDEEKIISHIGKEEFDKIQNHFEKSKGSSSSPSSNKNQNNINSSNNDDDDSLLDLLDGLEDEDDIDGELDLEKLGNGIEELGNLEDELIDEKNPEDELENYLNRVSKNDDFQNYIKELSNKKK